MLAEVWQTMRGSIAQRGEIARATPVRLLLSEKFGFQDRRDLQNAPEVVSHLDNEALVFRPFQNDIANSFDKRADRLLMRGVSIEQL